MTVTHLLTKRVKPVGKYVLTQSEVDFLRNRVGTVLANLEGQALDFKEKAKFYKKQYPTPEGKSVSDQCYAAYAGTKLEIKKLAGIQHKLKNLLTL
jgi:hypothetical protein